MVILNILHCVFVGVGSALFFSILKLMLYEETQDRFNFVFRHKTLCQWLRSWVFVAVLTYRCSLTSSTVSLGPLLLMTMMQLVSPTPGQCIVLMLCLMPLLSFLSCYYNAVCGTSFRYLIHIYILFLLRSGWSIHVYKLFAAYHINIQLSQWAGTLSYIGEHLY